MTLQKQLLNFKECTDEELVKYSREGIKEATEELLNRYQNLVKAKCRMYFLIGAEKDDIYQEGMIGLFKAVRDFDESKYPTFRLFAELCITRQVITAIKTASRQKHIPLNTYISLNKPVYEENDERTLLDTIANSLISDPEEVMITKEEFENTLNAITGCLSPFEYKVLNLYLEGRSYQEIAVMINKDVKSIDNALQRVKKKIEKYLSSSQV
ncbi:RNA polymerase sporulation sigma factor SigH [Caldicellulosiruptor naganoensis]|uniref:RNA polymerase sporulation sigma factor SigH n=1 Tax=Caldicellulosiruptor naganoensis TaxID=29324 RepID=A0ABY7BE14_9FIRM|nr:RNA polymerase sporulation sigma factor SigH [Caldicellulosiruptor naganoensis]WAM31062.1 RNA polymerase sporulation sigma factor SigH [Caldicellulosiruptor naganoensis]